MRILALDPAIKTGWAHSCGASGVFDLNIRRDESSGMRLLRLVAKLNEIAATVGVDVVVFEAARHATPGRQGALVVQSEIQGQIKAWCESQLPKVEYRGYSPSEIKKRALGGGKGNKEMMVEAAVEKWSGMEIVDDNQADALWLLDLATAELA